MRIAGHIVSTPREGPKPIILPDEEDEVVFHFLLRLAFVFGGHECHFQDGKLGEGGLCSLPVRDTFVLFFFFAFQV